MDQRNNNIHNKIMLAHLFCLLILFGIVLQNLNLNTINQQIHIGGYFLLGCLIFILDYSLFFLIDYDSLKNFASCLRNIVYIGIPLAAICIVVYLTQSQISTVLLLLPILIAGSQESQPLTYLVTIISVALLVSINYLVFLPITMNQVIRDNFGLICIFFFTGWFSSTLSSIEYKLRSQLNHMVNTDSLTGLPNYRAFMAYIKSIENRISANQPVSIVFFDIDDFKRFNDTYGHPQGDMVLSQIGKLLREVTTPPSFATRYGGEEFVVIMPNTNLKEAKEYAEQVRETVENTKLPEIKYHGNVVSISCGVAALPDHASTLSTLIKNADHALYKAKSLGKNRAEVYSSVFDALTNYDHEAINSIQTLIYVINAKDSYTYGHSERVVEFCTYIGNELSLAPETLNVLRCSAYLHDVGKIEIDRNLVNKPDKLTEDEFATIKQHSVWGSSIVKGIPELREIAPIILHHHENYDGTGYPMGLSGEDIPLLSRIIRVADSFDAMTSDRPYRQSLSLPTAISELEKGSGKQFDPRVVTAFIEVLSIM